MVFAPCSSSFPESATVLIDGKAVSIAGRDLSPGQLMLIKPGERLATDGIVRSGRSAVDTSAITGESIPVEVKPGAEVSAGAINTTGVLEVETTAAGTDNSLTTIVNLVEQAQSEKESVLDLRTVLPVRLFPAC